MKWLVSVSSSVGLVMKTEPRVSQRSGYCRRVYPDFVIKASGICTRAYKQACRLIRSAVPALWLYVAIHTTISAFLTLDFVALSRLKSHIGWALTIHVPYHRPYEHLGNSDAIEEFQHRKIQTECRF